MAKIEKLRFNMCWLDYEFHEIMKKCVKLKFLDINSIKDDGEINWPNRKYPTLECLKLSSFDEFKRNSGIAMFLEISPNIRKFIIADIILVVMICRFHPHSIHPPKGEGKRAGK